MTLEELFFNTSVFGVYVGPYSYGELNYCDRLHILITFIYIITPLLTSTHKPVLARAPCSLSTDAFRKIRHKQNMWRVYKHTGKDQDYVVYKEALNAATNDVRKSKRNFELKLAQNIKSDSKSFYAYVRSKQNVRDKVEPLEDNAGDKITEGILMAEELNMHFSSVFTREDTSSLPVPETKFNGSEEEKLGQLIVTTEVVASKINDMKENKSPGVDGLSPKILKETVEQISKLLAQVFNMSLQEGIVPLEWKEANIIALFKKGSRKLISL